jgi:hypothetical protein
LTSSASPRCHDIGDSDMIQTLPPVRHVRRCLLPPSQLVMMYSFASGAVRLGLGPHHRWQTEAAAASGPHRTIFRNAAAQGSLKPTCNITNILYTEGSLLTQQAHAMHYSVRHPRWHAAAAAANSITKGRAVVMHNDCSNGSLQPLPLRQPRLTHMPPSTPIDSMQKGAATCFMLAPGGPPATTAKGVTQVQQQTHAAMIP